MNDKCPRCGGEVDTFNAKITCHAEVCPACGGDGVVTTIRNATINTVATCSCCKGEGWIVVPNNLEETEDEPIKRP